MGLKVYIDGRLRELSLVGTYLIEDKDKDSETGIRHKAVELHKQLHGARPIGIIEAHIVQRYVDMDGILYSRVEIYKHIL